MARCSVSPPEGRITAGSFLFTQKPTSREVVNRCPTRDLPPPLVVSKLLTFSWPGASPIHCGPSSGPGVRPPVPIAPGMSSLHLVTALCSRLSRQCPRQPYSCAGRPCSHTCLSAWPDVPVPPCLLPTVFLPRLHLCMLDPSTSASHTSSVLQPDTSPALVRPSRLPTSGTSVAQASGFQCACAYVETSHPLPCPALFPQTSSSLLYYVFIYGLSNSNMKEGRRTYTH